MKEKHELVALLPIKGNSERVTGKNFKSFEGKPLFEWILESLKSIDEIELIVINTDVPDRFEKFNSGQNGKILIRHRDKDIQGDFVSMNKVIANDLEAIDSKNFLMTHTTNPLISPETIKKAITKYYSSLSQGFDSAFSVNRFQSRFYNADLQPLNHDPNNLIRTQDLKPVYEENSCLYLFNKESFGQTNARIGKKPNVIETPYYESVDIDDKESWKQAEYFSTLKDHQNEI